MFPMVLNLWKALTAKLNALSQQALSSSHWNITGLSIASSISPPLVTSEFPRCQVPCKTLFLHKRKADFPELTRQFRSPSRDAELEAAQCISCSHILYYRGQCYYPGQPGALSQPCWSAWNPAHQSSTNEGPDTVWRQRRL